MTENTDIRKKLVCPICKSPFECDGKSLVCTGERRHLFDLASSGYVNLLMPGRSRNSKTGDDSEMIGARKRFLATGHYDKISESIGDIILSDLKEKGQNSAFCVDSGCGEGYHTLNIAKTVSSGGADVLTVGFDASKKGASGGAARAYREGFANPFSKDAENGRKAFFAAGNIFNLPVKSKSVDYVTSLFSPVAGEENRRILKEDGKLIVAASGRNHLFELRKILYDKVVLPSGEVKCPIGFSKVGERVVRYKTVLESNAVIRDLFMMTPFYYRTSLADKEKLSKVSTLEITVETLICVFRPKE